jgi:pyruvate dehydrogenase (quinone)
MPPQATAKQLMHFAESLAKGTPAGSKIAWTVAPHMVREII